MKRQDQLLAHMNAYAVDKESNALLLKHMGVAGQSKVVHTKLLEIDPTTKALLVKWVGSIPGISMASTPVIYNVSMTLADTEYSQALPAGTKKFLLHTRDGSAFRLAFETGRVAGAIEPYFTVPVNTSYSEDLIEATGLILYFSSSSSNLTLEIIAWT